MLYLSFSLNPFPLFCWALVFSSLNSFAELLILWRDKTDKRKGAIQPGKNPGSYTGSEATSQHKGFHVSAFRGIHSQMNNSQQCLAGLCLLPTTFNIRSSQKECTSIGFSCQGLVAEGFSGGLCKKLLEASSKSNGNSANRLHEESTTGQGQAYQWGRSSICGIA